MTTKPAYRFRMRASGDVTDKDGCIIDAEGITWCDAPALRRKAERLEREQLAHAAHDAVFQRAESGPTSDEPTVEGGTLGAMAPGIWAKRNGKQ